MYYDKKDITFLYNGDRALDRKTLAYAMSMSNRINRQDLTMGKLSETLFDIIIEKLGVEPKAIFDKSNPYYQKELRGAKLSSWAWYQVLKHRPDLLRAPIALFNNKAIMCTTPTDMMKVN